MREVYTESYWSEDFGRWRRLARWLGLREVEVWRGRRWPHLTLRFERGELVLGGYMGGVSYSVYHESAHLLVSVGLVAVFVKLPVFITERPGSEDWNASFGFTTHRDNLHLNWRTACKVVAWPWNDWHGKGYRYEVLAYEWPHEVVFTRENTGPIGLEDWRELHEAEKEAQAAHSEVHDYHYLLADGTVQHVKATVSVYRQWWQHRWLGLWKSITGIDVAFSEEVGARRGSWKGGTVGCSWPLRHRERPKEALRRMQSERRFR